MSFLDKSILLQNLNIPGSHCANSNQLNNGLIQKNYARKQILNPFEQLNLGIRYLDLRFGTKSKNFQTENKLSYEGFIKLIGSPDKANRETTRVYFDVSYCSLRVYFELINKFKKEYR